MREFIEFHDSTLTSVDFVGTSLRLDLRAYVHRWEKQEGGLKGTGWIRHVRIVLPDGVGDNATELPVDLNGGSVRAGRMLHKDLVALPFSSDEATDVHLEPVTGGTLAFRGRSVAIESIGEAEYVESLPDDFAPTP